MGYFVATDTHAARTPWRAAPRSSPRAAFLRAGTRRISAKLHFLGRAGAPPSQPHGFFHLPALQPRCQSPPPAPASGEFTGRTKHPRRYPPPARRRQRGGPSGEPAAAMGPGRAARPPAGPQGVGGAARGHRAARPRQPPPAPPAAPLPSESSSSSSARRARTSSGRDTLSRLRSAMLARRGRALRSSGCPALPLCPRLSGESEGGGAAAGG